MPDGFDPVLFLGDNPSLWIALAVAVVMAAFLVNSRLRYLAIPKIPAHPPSPTPVDCMVVIPARNEEENISRAVRSFPHDTVIVVDDHSEDRTQEAAREAGAGVLAAPELIRGAIGKSNACAAGARVLTSRWILFADADTWYEPGFLDAAVAAAEASGLAFLSIYLQAECQTWAERILVPYAIALFFCGVNPRQDSQAVFNGQCILARRDAYEFIGGHAAVLTHLVEDVKFAALAERHRMKYASARATGLGHVRMQPGAFERNAARFMLVSTRMGAMIVAAALSMALWLPALVWLLLDRQWAVAAVFAAVPVILLRSWYRGWMRALLAPLAIVGILPVIFESAITGFTGRSVEWKGRIV